MILTTYFKTYARDRLRRGIVASEEVKKRVGEPNPQPHSTFRFEAHADTNSIHAAERRYMQERGSKAYTQLLFRLFDDLFPPERERPWIPDPAGSALTRPHPATVALQEDRSGR